MSIRLVEKYWWNSSELRATRSCSLHLTVKNHLNRNYNNYMPPFYEGWFLTFAFPMLSITNKLAPVLSWTIKLMCSFYSQIINLLLVQNIYRGYFLKFNLLFHNI